MAGPTSPGTEGPTFAPPQLPAGWIAQWDGSSKKYYFVQLSTGVSQWEVPTDAAPTGATPSQPSDHPYGVPQPELITHPDGSQTVRHADGTLEPVNPPMPPDNTNTRGLDGPTGDRGLGSMAMNALLGGKNSNQGSGSHGNSSSPLGGLANQLISGIGGHGNGHGSGGGGSGGKSSLGKLGGALASSLLSSGNKPQQGQPQNYHGNPPPNQHQQHGGLTGSLMGGVAHMFGGGKPTHGQGNDFGYSNNASGGGGGGGGGYSAQAPPTSYQPSGSSSHAQHSSPQGGGSSYHSPAPNQGQSHSQSFPPPPNQSHSQSYPPPPNQYPPTNQGQSHHNPQYGAPSQQPHNQSYGNVPPPPVGGPSSPYGQQPSYGAPPNQHYQQSQYGDYNPATYGSGAPHSSHPGGYPSQQGSGYGNHY